MTPDRNAAEPAPIWSNGSYGTCASAKVPMILAQRRMRSGADPSRGNVAIRNSGKSLGVDHDHAATRILEIAAALNSSRASRQWKAPRATAWPRPS